MTIHSLYPGYVEINYELAGFGPHTMTRPTRQWEGTPFTTPGSFPTWNGGTVSAAIMIEDFIDLLLPIYTDDVSFTGYTVYTVSAPGADPVPVYAANLTGKVGTNIFTGQVASWQNTYNFLTADGSNAKIVLMDCATGNQVKKTATVTGDDAALVAAFVDPDNAWAGRDDTRPVAFRQLSVNVNKALKKRYRL